VVATGGEDCIIRVYHIDQAQFSSLTFHISLMGHYQPVNAIDFSPDNKFLCSCSADKNVFIFNMLKGGQKIQTLHFNPALGVDSKNMPMRGCFFSADGKYLYTLATQARDKSYLSKFKTNETFDPVDTSIVHNQAAVGIKRSNKGDILCVLTSDGFVKVIAFQLPPYLVC